MNKSSFTARIFTGISRFGLVVYDFALTTTSVFTLKNRIKIVANMILSALVTVTIRIKSPKMVITGIKLRYSNFPTINLHSIRITANTKMIGKLSSVTIKNLATIVATSKAITKPIVTIKSAFAHVVATMSLGHFLALSVHDAKLLSVVDVVTLEDLDFTII